MFPPESPTPDTPTWTPGPQPARDYVRQRYTAFMDGHQPGEHPKAIRVSPDLYAALKCEFATNERFIAIVPDDLDAIPFRASRIYADPSITQWGDLQFVERDAE